MERDARAYLWDVQDSAAAITEFVGSKTIDDYLADRMLRSAVERQLGIIGEALSQLAKHFPELAQRIPELSRVIGLRNILIHGYTTINHSTVWSAVHDHLPALRQRASELLSELGASS